MYNNKISSQKHHIISRTVKQNECTPVASSDIWCKNLGSLTGILLLWLWVLQWRSKKSIIIELQHPVHHNISFSCSGKTKHWNIHRVWSACSTPTKRTHCIPVESIRRKCVLTPSYYYGSDCDVVAKLFHYCYLSVWPVQWLLSRNFSV